MGKTNDLHIIGFGYVDQCAGDVPVFGTYIFI